MSERLGQCKRISHVQGTQGKISQHPDIQAELLETHPLKLFEYSEDDYYWGDSGDHTGSSRLGHFLMNLCRESMDGEVN